MFKRTNRAGITAIILAVSVIYAFVLTGCGDDDTKTTTTTAETTTEATSAEDADSSSDEDADDSDGESLEEITFGCVSSIEDGVLYVTVYDGTIAGTEYLTINVEEYSLTESVSIFEISEETEVYLLEDETENPVSADSIGEGDSVVVICESGDINKIVILNQAAEEKAEEALTEYTVFEVSEITEEGNIVAILYDLKEDCADYILESASSLDPDSFESTSEEAEYEIPEDAVIQLAADGELQTAESSEIEPGDIILYYIDDDGICIFTVYPASETEEESET